MRKKSLICFLGIVLVAALLSPLIIKKNKAVPEEITPSEQETTPAKVTPKVSVKNTPQLPAKEVKDSDLDNYIDKQLPLSAIADLAESSEGVKNTVNKLLENSGIYFLKHVKNKYIIVTDAFSQDEENSKRRHDFEVFEIADSDGRILNDENYTKGTGSDVTEVWAEDESEPIKYKTTDKDGNVLSLRKESVENQTVLREEHIFYDKDGNTTKEVSFNYDGADLTMFTYFDSKNPEQSVTMVNEYQDGIKTKESVYSSDYKLLNSYVPKYQDGQKTEVVIYDADNNEVETLSN